MENILEILQKEIGVTYGRADRYIMATTRATSCTLFWGYESNLKIGFLCHFDSPCSTGSIPDLLDILKKIVNKGENHFKTHLSGGMPFLWSKRTRKKVKKLTTKRILDEYGLEFYLESEEPLKFCQEVTLRFDTRTGEKKDYDKSPKIRKNINQKLANFWKNILVCKKASIVTPENFFKL